jgi:hypothetical protein
MIICYGCDINNQKLLLINNTNDTIFYRLSIDSAAPREVQLNEALPHDSVWPNFVMGGVGAWEYKINTKSYDSTLHIFIFFTDKISDEVIANNQYKKIDLKIHDLESLKWTVVYE